VRLTLASSAAGAVSTIAGSAPFVIRTIAAYSDPVTKQPKTRSPARIKLAIRYHPSKPLVPLAADSLERYRRRIGLGFKGRNHVIEWRKLGIGDLERNVTW